MRQISLTDYFFKGLTLSYSHSERRQQDRFDKQKRPFPSGTGRFLVWPSYSPAISRIRGWGYFLGDGTAFLAFEFAGAGATVASAFSLEKIPSPMPLTFLSSSTDLKAPCC